LSYVCHRLQEFIKATNKGISGFICAYSNILGTSIQTCVSSATSTTIGAAFCESGSFSLATLTIPANSTLGPVTVTGAVDTITVYAPMIQLNYQPTDLPNGHSLSSNSSSSAPKSPSNYDSGSAGISKGGIAGIVIGSVIAASILIGVILYFLSIRKRRRQVPANKESEGDDSTNQEAEGYVKPELSGISIPNQRAEFYVKSELPGEGNPKRTALPIEMDAIGEPRELSSTG
jgi:hypothetical protein